MSFGFFAVVVVVVSLRLCVMTSFLVECARGIWGPCHEWCLCALRSRRIFWLLLLSFFSVSQFGKTEIWGLDNDTLVTGKIKWFYIFAKRAHSPCKPLTCQPLYIVTAVYVATWFACCSAWMAANRKKLIFLVFFFVCSSIAVKLRPQSHRVCRM